MDQHVLEFFQPYSEDSLTGHFHRVIALHENPTAARDELHQCLPDLEKCWVELATLPSCDRIDFTHEFWLTKIPYQANLKNGLDRFFSSLDDIGIFLTQLRYDDPFEAHLVYSLKKNEGFFHGKPPASEDEIISLKKSFDHVILPSDFIAFLQIHNGFSKLLDTGVASTSKVPLLYRQLIRLIESKETLLEVKNQVIDPKNLIPFYQSYGMPFYQCFLEEWYPENEMGNVYYSETNNTISDFSKKDASNETMAFDTFTDWLLFYLEKVD